MAKKGSQKKGGAAKKDEVERKRDERSRRNALKKEREANKYFCAKDDEDFISFQNQLQAEGFKIKDVKGDG